MAAMPSIVWAAEQVGTPWTPDFNCWALVRKFFADRHGVTMPDVAIGDLSDAALDNVSAIKRAAMASGWRRIEGDARADDLVLMRTPSGRRHIGLCVGLGAQTYVLHNNGCMTAMGACGMVEVESLDDLMRDGFSGFEAWRHWSS